MTTCNTRDKWTMKAIVAPDPAEQLTGMKVVERPEPPATGDGVALQVHGSGLDWCELARPATAAAIALALAIAATSTPALANSGAHRGYAARATASAVLDEGVSIGRAKVLRECSGRIAGFKGYNQMSFPLATYRTCMEQHGEPE